MKKKAVQNAKEQEQKSEPSPEHVEVASKEEAPSADNKEVAQKLIEIPQIDEDTKKMLAKAGFSWDSFVQAFAKINIWAEKVDSTQKALIEAVSGVSNEKIAEALHRKLLESQEKQKAEFEQMIKKAEQADAGGQGGGLAEKAFMKILLGEGGGLSEADKFFIEAGKELTSLGMFTAKESIRKAIGEGFSRWEEEYQAKKSLDLKKAEAK